MILIVRMTDSPYLQVALPVPLRRLFHYSLPDTCLTAPHTGTRVRVSFAGRQLVGLVMGESDHPGVDEDKVKAVDAIIDAIPILDRELLSFIHWAADYYHCPLGEALQTALPVLLRQGEDARFEPEESCRLWDLTPEGRGLPETPLPRAPKQAELLVYLREHGPTSWQTLKEQGFSRDPLKRLDERGLIATADPDSLDHFSAEPPLALNPQQARALEALAPGKFAAHLLDGTTGSGKTEVYLQAIERVRKVTPTAQALVLVPEIGLTPQTIARFRRRFGPKIAVLHSGLTDRERLNSWVLAATGRAQIVIGTRSAIFTPLAKPGLIIVDEEHDLSFKQQEGFRYSARDLASVRAQRLGIPVILGSATPALESLHNARAGRYHHLQLTQRANSQATPQIIVSDSHDVPASRGVTEESLAAIGSHLASGNQVLVFLNRRGYAPTLQCHDCGTQLQCPHCDARLTLHHNPRHLHCHHCDFQRPQSSHCEHCHSHRLVPLGLGTERSEEFLKANFPQTPVLRIDRDTTRSKHALERLMAQIHSGEACILVGTQMLAKGHHFPDVTLAIIMDVDGGLLSADFRGPERMGQLITQVAGRAGRADKAGQVILQTRNREHPLLQLLVHQGYGAFAQALLSERDITRMPPFAHLALVRADAPNAEIPQSFLKQLRQQVEAAALTHKVQLLGPMPALMEKRGQRYRYQLQAKAESRGALHQFLQALVSAIEAGRWQRALRWSLDIDPQDMS